MSRDSRIKEGWRSTDYSDARSYTRMPYPAVVANLGQSVFRDAVIAVIAERTRDAQPFRRVVDLGCGVGDWTMEYLRFAERATGVDINESFVARAQQATADEAAVDFAVGDIAAWSDFADAEFVACGASMMYLTASECDAVVRRVASAQGPGDHLYVRATVLNPGRAPHSTAGGYYRPKPFYRCLFARNEYETVFEAYSSSLATAGTLVRATGLGHRPARAAMLGINGFVMAARMIGRDVDYCNWLLRRR